MIILLTITLLLVLFVVLYLQHPKFGRAPGAARRKLIADSPNFKSGKFENEEFTPFITEGYSMASVMYNFIFKKLPEARPTGTLPSIKTDLKNIDRTQDVLVWFGHSSYFIQLNGKRFLIDPVFSGNASPIPNSNRSFPGSDIYSADDMPEIDHLLITHDHYDHLDYSTIIALKPKIRHIICGLGVGEHFERWKFDSSIIEERNWNESVVLSEHTTLYTAPARHFSGRTFKRNNTLWLSFILETAELRLYLGGDSGYGKHFNELGKKFGSFDLAILDNGQYNLAWQAIHMLPEEGLKAAKELHAKRLFPVHSSKFKLADHAWDEPLKTISQLNEKENPVPLATPKIGEIVYLKNGDQQFIKWWEEIDR
jgi:L-ascorbate metabolism protein UlaG (beta-lactamase superfamily)